MTSTMTTNTDFGNGDSVVLRNLRSTAEQVDPRGCVSMPASLRGATLSSSENPANQSSQTSGYYLEPTWRINPVQSPLSPPSSRSTTATTSSSRSTSRHDHRRRSLHSRGTHGRATRNPSFKDLIRGLDTSELREVIMNACLRDFDTHRDVVTTLKRLQSEKPRAICCGLPTGHVRRPVVGLYLYSRSQRELVDIVLDLEHADSSGDFRRDVKDLVTVMRERDSGD